MELFLLFPTALLGLAFTLLINGDDGDSNEDGDSFIEEETERYAADLLDLIGDTQETEISNTLRVDVPTDRTGGADTAEGAPAVMDTKVEEDPTGPGPRTGEPEVLLAGLPPINTMEEAGVSDVEPMAGAEVPGLDGLRDLLDGTGTAASDPTDPRETTFSVFLGEDAPAAPPTITDFDAEVETLDLNVVVAQEDGEADHDFEAEQVLLADGRGIAITVDGETVAILEGVAAQVPLALNVIGIRAAG